MKNLSSQKKYLKHVKVDLKMGPSAVIVFLSESTFVELWYNQAMISKTNTSSQLVVMNIEYQSELTETNINSVLIRIVIMIQIFFLFWIIWNPILQHNLPPTIPIT